MQKDNITVSINDDGAANAEDVIVPEVQQHAQPSLGEMKRGDYMIHVFVERAKEMKGQYTDDTVDPMVEVSCMGIKKYTTSKKNISQLGEVTWNEHLFLEMKNVEKQQAEDGRIMIKLLDKHFIKDLIVGQFEFDLTHIYFMENHLMLHQWMALSNPNSESYSQITGYLKVSISVACTGDKQVQITQDDGAEEDDNVLMPPQLNPTFYQIRIRIFQAQQIPPMDQENILQAAKTDAYVMTTYKNRKLKTKVRVMDKEGSPVHWNQEFYIPAQYPIISGRLMLKVMDEDKFIDEIVGSIEFDMNEIISGKYTDKYIWRNIYGSPMNQSNSKFKKEMNENPEVASYWKGRVLLQVLCQKTDTPLVQVKKIPEKIVEECQKHFRVSKQYDIIAEVGQGVCLPSGKNYRVQINVGGCTLTTGTGDAQFNNKTYRKWNTRFEQQTMTNLPYKSCQDFENIIVSLLDEKMQPVCYYKDKIINYLDPDAQYKWVSLTADKCVGKVTKTNDAGIISFKLSINDISLNKKIDFKDYNAWRNMPEKRYSHIKIRAYIYQCKDLPAADSDGTSDPYIRVWDISSQQQKQTQVIQDNTNPLYYEVMELEYEVRKEQDIYSYPPFIFDLFDQDIGVLEKDDYLGRAIIYPDQSSIVMQKDFETCSQHNAKMCQYCIKERAVLEVPQVPKWHPIRFSPSDPVAGEILVSFAATSLEYRYTIEAKNIDLKSRVQNQKFEVNMLILGLRNLQSPGFLPVKKAFVSFNLKSLVPPNSSSVQNIKTQPKASGPNPTINTSMKFTIPLPTDTLYCPKLTCAVFDYIFKGWNQPMIGVFTLPIGDLMLQLKKARVDDIDKIENVIEQLDRIMKESGQIYNVKDYVKKKKPKGIKIEDLRTGLNESKEDNAMNASTSSPRNILNQIKSASQEYKQGRIKKKAEKAFPNETIELGASEAQGVFEAQEMQFEKLNDLNHKLKDMRRDSFNQKAAAGFLISPYDQIRREQSGVKEQKSKLEEIKEREAVKEQIKRIEEDDRKRAMEELLGSGDQASQIVIRPKFKMDERLGVEVEDGQPPDAMFMGLGWHRDDLEMEEQMRNNPNSEMIHDKHYRQQYKDELENVKEIFPRPSPFDSFNLKRGQNRGIQKGGIMSFLKNRKQDESGQISTDQIVGIFKGIIEIESEQDKKEYYLKKRELLEVLTERLQAISMAEIQEKIEIDPVKLGCVMHRRNFEKKMRELNLSSLNISQHLQNLESDEILKRSLLSQTQCLVRIYMIEAFNLSARDIGSDSDPYLIIKCNNKVYNERDNYQLDEPNPKFYKHYDFEAVFPGCSPVVIDVYDWDEIFGDDLIGTTVLDLEDRYFSMEWKWLQEKPIEYRELYHNSSSISQGTVILWAEINQLSIPSNQIDLWDITEKPPVELEVRVCVFNATDVEMMDVEGTSDVFFKAYFDSNDIQETDTHYRNQDGCPDFQYRLIYRIKVSSRAKDKDYKFTIQCYDRDFLSSNELIGEDTLKLQRLINDCSLVKRPMQFNKEFYDDLAEREGFQKKMKFDESNPSRFWLDMNYKNENSKKKKLKQKTVRGKVKIQIDVLPAEMADKNPVGKARQEPNHSPYLPQPAGRLSLTINPFKMWEQMIGPGVRRRIYWLLCCILCCVTLIMIAPSLAGNALSTWLVQEWSKITQ